MNVSSDDYHAAFELVGMSQLEEQILATHIETAGQSISHDEIGQMVGGGGNVVSARLGALGHRVADALDVVDQLPIRPSDQKPIWSAVLGEWDDGVKRWNLFPEVVQALRNLGVSTHASEVRMPRFVVGRLYNRRADIHDVVGGQMQSGISTPTLIPAVLLFTGDAGSAYGYLDDHFDDGRLQYFGEGQVGDMTFTGGNKAIRDHAQNGKTLLLFKTLGKSQPVQFLGEYALDHWSFGSGPDKDGNTRRTIRFNIIPIESGSEELVDAPVPQNVDLPTLRAAALAAGQSVGADATSGTSRSYYTRSKQVRDYVLARANGICECCENPAPFVRKDGSHYLEPHHIRRRSDGGPDHIAWVAGICPNCHREVHSGMNGRQLNESLGQRIQAKEGFDVKSNPS